MAPLDISEPSTKRADREFRSFISRPLGAILLAIAAAAGGGAAALLVPGDWSSAVTGLAIAASGAAGVTAFVAVSLIVFLIVVLRTQRNEARARLKEIKTQAYSYEIAALGAHTAGNNIVGGDIVRLDIVNRIRGAHFAAVVERLDGIEEELIETRYACWLGCGDDREEEIPTGERRTVGLGFIRKIGPNQLAFTAMGARELPVGRQYTNAGPGSITIWVRISARRVPEIGYSRLIGVETRWSGGDDEIHVGLAADPSNAEGTTYAPSLPRS